MGSVAAASPLRGGGYNATEMDSGGDLEQHMDRAQLQQYYEQKQKRFRVSNSVNFNLPIVRSGTFNIGLLFFYALGVASLFPQVMASL